MTKPTRKLRRTINQAKRSAEAKRIAVECVIPVTHSPYAALETPRRFATTFYDPYRANTHDPDTMQTTPIWRP